MDRFLYTGERTRHISLRPHQPDGRGVTGAGGIGLAGNGHLVDWEIFNKPNKGSVNGFSHFAIRVEEAGATVDARILQGDSGLPTPPFMGDISQGMFQGFGFGPRRRSIHERSPPVTSAMWNGHLQGRVSHWPRCGLLTRPSRARSVCGPFHP